MTNKKPSSERKLELSPAQVAGSALAAISAAFFASWAGTAGTIIGAALASVFATAGTAMYTWWLRRTSDAVRRTASQVRVTGLGSAVVVPSLARTRSSGAPAATDSWRDGSADAGRPESPEEDPEEDLAEEPSRWSFLYGRPWGKVALATVAVMLAALGSITVVEAVTGKPMASYLRGDSSTGTSVGHLVGTDPSTPTPSPSPTKATQPTPTPTPTPKGQSTPTPTPSIPTPTPSQQATPTPAPGTPTPTPSATPQGGQTAGDGATPTP